MKALLLLILLLLTSLSPLTFLTPRLHAQSSATVHGAVTDESGAVIPGAKVTVSNAAGPVKSGTAGDDGSYSITGLAPGQYSVQATSPGLQQVKPFAVDLSASPGATANLQLQVAAEKQEVTVQENAGPAVSVDPSQNAGALVLRGADLQALVRRSGRSAGRFAGPGRTLRRPQWRPDLHRRIYRRRSCRAKTPSARSASIRIRFRPNTTSSATDASRSSPSPAPTSCTATSSPTIGDAIFDSRNPYAAQKAPFLQRELRRIHQRRAGQEGVVLSGFTGSRHRQRKYHQRLQRGSRAYVHRSAF